MKESQIHFATTNNGKVTSLQKALDKHQIEVIQVPLDIQEPRIENIRDISFHKVLEAYKHIGKRCVAQDTGFFVDSLNGFPKTYVNFALDTIGIEGIVKLVEDKPRQCSFKNCLSYYDETLKEPAYFESISSGTLSTQPLGQMQKHFWSKLLLVFIPDGYDKTVAQFSDAEYQEYRKERAKNSFTDKFANWYVSR